MKTRKRHYYSCYVFFFVAICNHTVDAAIVQEPVGFDSANAEGWVAGRSFVNPIVEPSGGRDGDGDAFLKITANGGNGPGSIAAVFNDGDEWTGDFVTPGITGLSIDMMSPATSSSLDMRLVLFGPNSTASRWTSNEVISVANDGVWRNYVFPIGESQLTRVLGSSTIDAVLADADRIMLRHDPGAPSVGGAASRAVLGIDNIRFQTGLVGDYNGNGQIDAGDLDVQATGISENNLTFDLDADGDVDIDDRFHWVRTVQQSWIGDSNFDGEFSSSDFVAVFGIGKYETGAPATYAEGDWNGDLLFDSGDFVVAFQDGGFEQGARPLVAVPEPTTLPAILLAGIVAVFRYSRRLAQTTVVPTNSISNNWFSIQRTHHEDP